MDGDPKHTHFLQENDLDFVVFLGIVYAAKGITSINSFLKSVVQPFVVFLLDRRLKLIDVQLAFRRLPS